MYCIGSVLWHDCVDFWRETLVVALDGGMCKATTPGVKRSLASQCRAGASRHQVPMPIWLTHWGRVTHICVGKLTIVGSDNGLSPGRRQAIIRTNAGILLIGTLATNFSDFLIGIQTFSFKKLNLKTSSAKWRLFCLGLNELIVIMLKPAI